MPADFEVITSPIDPATEPPLKDPTIEVVNLIAGLFTRPHLDRVLCAEGMAWFEVARLRDGLPHLLR
jgi:hypothetical protein